MTTTVARKSLPLTARDLRDLDILRGSPARRGALASLVDIEVGETLSEAQLLHAVLEAGLRAVEERIEEDGYARIAAERSETEQAARRAVARRRRPSWADESSS
jgi:hypothetical protein